ncbi:MAG: serine hydroxymethyltransferase [Anaerolineae bacterium]|nr:serine hydroxymethyltransferase [Anaerolineae bacterium]
MGQKDFLFRDDLVTLDPEVAALIGFEEARQHHRLILIPSESTISAAVRSATASVFQNIYAEGYPLQSTRKLTEAEILDYEARLAEYRRNSDERYYKGTEYADIVEALARRRAAELFATPAIPAEKLWVNVQPLSGAPANNAVYSALVQPGETVMGMDLLHGGHLTHGSPVNRSGIYYHIVSYGVDPQTERLDYDAIQKLAEQHRPRLIICGFTSYPYVADYARFRQIADSVGAYLLADISHIAGLTAAGVVPSPIGHAHVVSFTTHKTMDGPRGAVLITHDSAIGRKLDRAVFPGEQGGPHINAMAGMAVAFKLARTEQFRRLQEQTIRNAVRLAEKLAEHGFRIPYGGTDSHMLLLDCKSITGPDGTPLSGDMAARILDLAGIVLNRNTIPGDKSAFSASGLRMGTPWLTQRGFREPEIDRLAAIISNVLHACTPFSYLKGNKPQLRSKVDFDVLQQAALDVRTLVHDVGIDTPGPDGIGYPHVYYIDSIPDTGWHVLEIIGEDAEAFLQAATTNDVLALGDGDAQATNLLNPDGTPISRGVLKRLNRDTYHLHVDRNAGRAAAWLRSLSDGFVRFDPLDLHGKLPGPVIVREVSHAQPIPGVSGDGYTAGKAFFIGVHGERYSGPKAAPLPAFSWEEPADQPLRKTTLNALHRELGAKMVPFAGWDMPVWYSSVAEEHLAVRNSAGVFDVSHMGVWDISGRGAEAFLDALTTNDVRALKPGTAHYNYLLGVDGVPIDDIFVYRLAADHFMIVVNASNDDKDWAWVSGLIDGKYLVDPANPGAVLPGRHEVTLRNLRDPRHGPDMRVDIALQGPSSRDILLSLHASEADRTAIKKLPWAGIAHVTLKGYDVIVTRTGYTGERIAYELFLHPDKAPAFFKDLVDSGAVPCGLAARDSLRTEAGLPLYGHELAGILGLGPADAGFGGYVKTWKPFFVGKRAFLEHERTRSAMVTRFRLNAKGMRPPQPGDPVVEPRGRVIGMVTSCSIDSEGYQLGQAYIKTDFLEEGTPIAIYTGAEKLTLSKPFGQLRIGDKAPVPTPATVLSRFPKRE